MTSVALALAYRAPFPSGTILPAFNATAPLYWTKGSAHNDKPLRLVTGTPSSGGSSPFSTVFAKTAVDNKTLLPADFKDLTFTWGGQSSSSTGINSRFMRANTSNGSSSSYNASSSGGDGAHAHGFDIRINYVDMIQITKD